MLSEIKAYITYAETTNALLKPSKRLQLRVQAHAQNTNSAQNISCAAAMPLLMNMDKQKPTLCMNTHTCAHTHARIQ